MAQHKFRINRLDKWILGDRDPYRPVYLLRFVRLQYAFATSMMIVILFVGSLWHSAQQEANENCQLRNQQTIMSRKVLDQLVAANHADGDKNAEMVWRQWVQVSRQTPLPKC